MTNIRPTVYLVDDDKRVLVALKRLLTLEGYSVACYSSGEEFLRCHDPEAPGCAIIDLGLPGIDGFAIQDTLSSGLADRALIFLTGRGDIPASVKAMKAGAIDFLAKPPDASSLLEAVAQALQRDSEARQDRERRKIVEQRLSSLTPREREVLTRVVAGRLNKQIAAELGIVEKTIKVHRGRVMGKMGVRTLADLVRLVARHQV
jgi:RNA polymerase sigma factor (sigma-70 family)